MPIRLIASDLDGTLLAPDHRLSARTIAAVGAVRQAGIDVVPVTGRGFRTAIDLVRPADVDTAICSNGALVYDITADRIASMQPIDGPSVRAMIGSLRAELPEMVFGWETPISVSFEPDFHTDQRFGAPAGEPLHLVEGAMKVFARHPTILDVELQHVVQPLLPGGMAVSTSGAPFVEVTAAGVDKGTALASLAAARGIERHEVMAFGDQMNDLAMLSWAGVGVAMGNARPEAKAAADRVARPNGDDGVARVIEELL